MIHLSGKELPLLPPIHLGCSTGCRWVRLRIAGHERWLRRLRFLRRSESACMIGFSYTVRLDGCGLTGKARGPMIRSCRMAAREAAV